MMRIKLFGLFIAFALLALVRPRKCLELLEAADRGATLAPAGWQLVPKAPTAAMLDVAGRKLCEQAEAAEYPETPLEFQGDARTAWAAMLAAAPAPECPLPPAGWRCTRRAGHDGPCAAVVK